MTALTDCLQAALEYAALGIRVFPVHVASDGVCSCGKKYTDPRKPKPGECISPGKHPRTANGVKDATTDATIIKGWWARWPNSNVAAALAESGLIDVECDSPEAEADYTILIGDDPPVCPVFRSHRGRHRLFARLPDMPSTKQAGRIEIRGCTPNLYSLFPPSLHWHGDTYTWLVPLSEFDELPPMPQSLIIAMTDLAGEAVSGDGKPRRPPEHWQQGLAGTSPGGRTDFAISYIGKMLREMASLEDGASVQLVLDSAIAINERNSPPLPVEKLTKDFNGILQREKARRINVEVAETMGIELTDSGELPQGFAFFKVQSDPPRYEWHAPTFERAEGKYVVLTAEQFLSGAKVQRAVFEQADVFLTASFVKQWGKRSQGADGKWKLSIAERLAKNMEYQTAPPEEQRWRIVAELLLEKLERARPVEEGAAPDAKGRPCKVAKGIVFKVTFVWRDLNFDADRVTRPELCKLLRRVGATDFRPPEARGKRFKLITPEGLASLRDAASGEDAANALSI